MENVLGDLEERLGRLGYVVTRRATDNLGRRWRWRVGPACGPGGSVSYFNGVAAMRRYVEQVEEVRAMAG